MSYSSLATVVVWSPCKSSREGTTIDSVAIHTMANNTSAKDCGDWFSRSSTQASSNYGIGSDGTIGVYVDESERSWCTSNGGVDRRAVTIEVASVTAFEEPYNCTAEAYESLIKLLVDICNRNPGIKGLKWKGDKDYAISASNGGPVTEQNMFVHRWFDDKACPGEYLYSKQGDIANEVNSRLKNGISYQGDGTSSSSSTSSGTGLSINYEKINPYVMFIDRKSKDIPYKKLKTSRIVGAIIEGGYLYKQSSHAVVKEFESPEIRTQVTQLLKQLMPYGIYMYARARNAKEAKAEMDAFSYVLRKYMPAYGAWLYLDLSKRKAANSHVLDRYISDLSKMGYNKKMGIICTRETLKTIDWDKYQDNFWLYIIDHVKDTSDLNKLLDPTFFDIDGKG